MGIKRVWFTWVLLTVISVGGLCVFPASVISGPPIISEGTQLPGFKMDMTLGPEMMKYLGVEAGPAFTLNQIQSKLVVIEIFSALCKECHKNAPGVNKLYHIISNDSELNPHVKMLGIAVGNDTKLADAYSKTYKVKFPVVADPEEKINMQLGNVATPSIIVADNKGTVLYFHEGIMEDMDQILDVLRAFYAQ